MQRSNNKEINKLLPSPSSPTPLINDDPNFDPKFAAVTDRAPAYLKEHLVTKITSENLQIIISYILAFQIESGPSQQYRIVSMPKRGGGMWSHCRLSFRFVRESVFLYAPAFSMSLRCPQ